MFKLRPYQESIAVTLFDYLINNPGKHPLIGMPTGSGKTVVIADIIQKTLERWPETNILVLSHVKEIVKQDYDTLSAYLDDSSILGINSSGLGRREIKKVTIANIQSVYRKPDLFKDYKFVIIDEAHLIPPTGDGMYRRFLTALDAVYLGLTATYFRLGTGFIFGQDDSLFSDVIYDLTQMDNFNKLITDGYLCPLRPVATDYQYDTQKLHVQGGEFIEREMANKFDREGITNIAIKETIKKGKDCKKWLIFAIDIDHAEHIAEELIRNGVSANIVHSKMEGNRDRIIRQYKRGKFRALVNVNVLTTGFDSPDIDLIGLLRPTLSPVLHVQMIGRGLRVAHDKKECLILDFAGNTARLGPINDIHPHRKRRTEKDGEPITKTCPSCNTICHPKVKTCEHCGHEFQFIQRISVNASPDEIVVVDKIKWLKVDEVNYSRHKKKNAPDSVKVTYRCGMLTFREWVCLDHPGNAGWFARRWVNIRNKSEYDVADVNGILSIQDKLKIPTEIQVDKRGKYPIVTDYKFD